MFTTATSANYRCTEGLLVWYEQERDDDTSSHFLKLTRHATKKYEYLDINPDSAATIADAKRDFYTRTFADWQLETVGTSRVIRQNSVTECKSEISSYATDFESRTISIAVNETDVKYVSSPSGFVNNPASYFTAENARDYEESVHQKTSDGISSYSRKRNFRVASDLAIRYRTEKSGSGFIYTRYANKSFEYIGMNQTAAENCAKAKRSQYCREYDFVSGTSNKTKIANGASIALSHDNLTWSVSVRVNETDVKYSPNNVLPATLFTSENGRAYDGGDLLVLESVTRETPAVGAITVRTHAVGSCNIPDHTLGSSTFEYRIGEDIMWRTASVEWVNNNGTLWLPVTDLIIYCRLTCASTESDTIIAE